VRGFDVGDGTDHRPDLRLHVALDGRLGGAAALLAADERHLRARFRELRFEDLAVTSGIACNLRAISIVHAV
jgi:hypothetical protein